jgi:hypothetical protein
MTDNSRASETQKDSPYRFKKAHEPPVLGSYGKTKKFECFHYPLSKNAKSLETTRFSRLFL